MLCFNAKFEVQNIYLRIHESKLEIRPENFAESMYDLAERPEIMYELHAFEQADWQIRSWGCAFQHKAEAIAKLAEQRLQKSHSLRSEVTKRRGILWCSDRVDSPNFLLDEAFDEEGVSKHDLYEQWTPLLDLEVDYEALNYLDERYPELL